MRQGPTRRVLGAVLIVAALTLAASAGLSAWASIRIGHEWEPPQALVWAVIFIGAIAVGVLPAGWRGREERRGPEEERPREPEERREEEGER